MEWTNLDENIIEAKMILDQLRSQKLYGNKNSIYLQTERLLKELIPELEKIQENDK